MINKLVIKKVVSTSLLCGSTLVLAISADKRVTESPFKIFHEQPPTCDNNFDCEDTLNFGCCNKKCVNYKLEEAECQLTPNRPLYAFCTDNQQCGDSCCGLT